MILAVLIALGAGVLHAYGLDEGSAGAEGMASALSVLAVVIAIASLPPEIAKVLAKRDSERG
jgi:hypothetical protein